MSSTTGWIYAATFVLAAAGFLVPFWPLSVVGVAIAALSQRWLFALALGLLLDVAWGAPTGLMQYLFFPFALLALLCALLRLWSSRYLFDRAVQETL